MSTRVGGIYSPVELLIQSAHTVTTPWADLGLLIDTRGFNHVAIWLKIDINSGTDLQLRCLARRSEDSQDDYLLPIREVSAGLVKLQDEYLEFADNIDQNMIIACDTDNLIPFCQFQIQATVGQESPIITTCHYSTGY